MGRAKFKPYQIIPVLREVELEIGKGMSLRKVCWKSWIKSLSIITGGRSTGGLKLDQAKRLKELDSRILA